MSPAGAPGRTEDLTSTIHQWESPIPDDLLDGAAGPSGTAVPTRSVLEHGWWSVVAWACGLLLGAGALSDNSFLTHLATGRLIQSSGAPHADVFTFSSGGRHIVVQSWLASWWYATLDSIGGPNLIRLFVAFTCGAILLTLWRLSAPAGSLLGRLALVTMAGMVGLLWWNERPQVVAFLCLALVALVLQERRSPWWMIPLFGLWVNVHGSFPLGVAFVGVSLAVRALEARRIAPSDVTAAAAMVAGVVGGAFVSPYGMELITFPIELLGRSSSLILIAEWRPLDLVDDGQLQINNAVFVAQAAGILALLAWRRSWLRLVASAVFVAMALMAVRNVAVAALVLVPLAAPALAGLGSPDVSVVPPCRRRLAVGGVVSALVVAFVVSTPGYDLGAYPVAAANWMEKQGYIGRADGDDAAVLAHDYDGNYLEWRYGAAANVWIDDRAELHRFETIRDYVLLLSGLGDRSEILERNPHDLIVWSAQTRFARWLGTSDEYEVVYRDDSRIVACRLASERC